ncbi:MAG: type I pantothenate kinase, partial [Arsenophonus sp. NC-QC1-MAG3]
MKQQQNFLITPYLEFDREHWETLRGSVPLELLTDKELLKLKGINDEISMDEVNKIYLPISRLLNFYISSNLLRQTVLEQFLCTNGNKVPYVIGIAGSVAVGKSTTARLLQTLLSRWPEHRKVDLIA